MSSFNVDHRLSRRLVRHHVPLALFSAVAVAAIYFGLSNGSWAYRSSMATAYVGLALLAATMLLGSAYRLAGKANPVSNDLRRDLGIWAAIVCLAHVATGLLVHHNGQFYKYFLKRAEETGAVVVRGDFIGWANHIGLAAGGLLMILLAISNDAALRKLGASRWKRVQMLSYLALALSAAHGLMYQIRAEQSWSLMGVVIGLTAAVLCAKAAATLKGRG